MSTKKKLIGTSFSSCLFSIARGEVNVDEVAFIITSTAYPSREVMVEQVRQTMLSKDLDTHVANACILWDSGRIYQPSTRPNTMGPADRKTWFPAPEMFNN